MRLSEASVVIRPRTPWEAVDLGLLLAKQHAALLMLSWACVSLPVFALLCWLLWDSPSVVVLLLWWLKPAFERLPLYILSNALFGAKPSLKQALKAWPGLLRPQLLASLTWRRFSLSRSFTLPVQQLEGLKGQARQQRLFNLTDPRSRTERWLTIVGVHLESVLWLGAPSLMYLLLPNQLEINWQWYKLLDDAPEQWLWLEHLSNFSYALVLIIWEPIYVACGFSLYLNRRTLLEAWDIEIKFRQLSQRLKAVVPAVALAFALLLMHTPDSAVAATASTNSSAPQPDEHGPKAARLLEQPLNSEQAQHSIEQLLAQPPFNNTETVTRWRLGSAEAQAEDKSNTSSDFLRGLQKMKHWFGTLNAVTNVLEVLLWASLLALVGWLLWRYREWLAAFAGRAKRRQRQVRTAPEQLFGLQVSPDSLPDDLLGEVQRLWQQQPREALGLLYRALLSRLLHEQHLHLTQAHTESEVLQHIAALQQPALNDFSQTLTLAWQNMAYGHRPPPAELKQQLCDAWCQLFSPGVPA